MGHFITSHDIPEQGEHMPKSRFAMLKMGLAAASVILSLLSYAVLLGYLLPGYQADYCYSWLFAFAFFTTISIGACFWVLLNHLANSSWNVAVRRVMENLGFVFPFLALFAVPFFFPSVQKVLFEWMRTHYETKESLDLSWGVITSEWLHYVGVQLGNIVRFLVGGIDATKDCDQQMVSAFAEKHEVLLVRKYWYLNLPYYYVRLTFYFLALGWVIWRMRRLSIAQDNDPNPGTKRLFIARAFSSAGIPILGITVTFLAIDLLMALDYKWFSTMWGVYIFAGSAMSSMAALIIAVSWLRKHGYLHKVVTIEHYHVMGKLLFAFVVFWSYIAFSQFFLIWYANITEETRFFLLRNTEGWNLVSMVLVFFHFAVPFVILLFAGIKKNVRAIVPVCVYILLIHAVDMYWIIIPERGPSNSILKHQPLELISQGAFWGDIIALIAIGCGVLSIILRNFSSAATYPHRDPRILESANLHN